LSVSSSPSSPAPTVSFSPFVSCFCLLPLYLFLISSSFLLTLFSYSTSFLCT
jgi:hypothetical protein